MFVFSQEFPILYKKKNALEIIGKIAFKNSDALTNPRSLSLESSNGVNLFLKGISAPPESCSLLINSLCLETNNVNFFFHFPRLCFYNLL